MSFSNFNKLVSVMPNVEAEEARRSAKKRARTTASLNGGIAKKTGSAKKPGSGKKTKTSATGSVKPADTDSAGDDHLNLINVELGAVEVEDERFTGMRIDTVVDENDDTLIESEDALAVSRAKTKAKKTKLQVCMSL
jgi:hypothetical protein